jgi:hypothetical protein
VQDPALFLSLQIAFAPHGDGLHGSLGTSAGGGTKMGKAGLQFVCLIFINLFNDTSSGLIS